MPGFKMTSS